MLLSQTFTMNLLTCLYMEWQEMKNKPIKKIKMVYDSQEKTKKIEDEMWSELTKEGEKNERT